jgi:hypothetical protein
MTNRKCYPKNWHELARACKERANWKCEHCGIEQYTLVTSRKGTPYIVYLHACHVNHDKGNPHPQLKALCIACHARLDYEHQKREARVRIELLRHLRLLIEQGVVTVRASDG